MVPEPPLIVVDTTTVHRDWTLSGSSWVQLLSLASRGLVELAAPVTVLMEGARQHLEHIESVHSKMSEQAAEFMRQRARLHDAGLQQPIEPVSATWQAPTRADHVLALTNKIEGSRGEVLPIPTVAHEELVNRDLDRVLPFQATGKGYRDSLIWLSLVQRTQRCTAGQRLYFVSGNTKDYLVNGALSLSLKRELPPSIVEAGVEVVETLAALLELPELKTLRNQIRDAARSGSVTQPAAAVLHWPPYRDADGGSLTSAEDAASALISYIDGLASYVVATKRSPDEAGLDFTLVDIPPDVSDVTIDYFDPFPQTAEWEIFDTSEETLLIQASIMADVSFDGVMSKGEYYLSEAPNVVLVDEDLSRHAVSVGVGDTVVLVFRASADPATGLVTSIELDHARSASSDDLGRVLAPAGT